MSLSCRNFVASNAIQTIENECDELDSTRRKFDTRATYKQDLTSLQRVDRLTRINPMTETKSYVPC